MKSPISLGYLQFSDEAIEIFKPTVIIGGVPYDIESEESTGWRYEIPVSVEIRTNINLDLALKSAGLPPNAVTAGFIKWRSSTTKIHGHSKISKLQDGANSFQTSLKNKEISGTITFSLVLILVKNPNPSKYSLSAKTTGSRLWQQDFRFDLEGIGSQFPTEAVNFRDQGLPSDALWYVEINGPLEAHINEAACLYLNTNSKRILGFLKNPSTPENLELRRHFHVSFTCQMMEYLLRQNLQDIEMYSNEPNSLAESLASLHFQFFGEQEIEETQEKYKRDPGYIHSFIQDSFFSEDL